MKNSYHFSNLIGFDHQKNEHIIIIKFKIPIVNDGIKFNDADDLSKGYKVKVGKDELEGRMKISKGGRPRKNSPSNHRSAVMY